jgi:hypothetical protein
MTGLWAGQKGFDSRHPDGAGAHPSSYPMGTGGSFLWSEVAVLETDHSPVLNTCNYTSTPPYVFMASYLVKHRATLPLLLPLREGG